MKKERKHQEKYDAEGAYMVLFTEDNMMKQLSELSY